MRIIMRPFLLRLFSVDSFHRFHTGLQDRRWDGGDVGGISSIILAHFKAKVGKK